jgi:hypothetical protein
MGERFEILGAPGGVGIGLEQIGVHPLLSLSGGEFQILPVLQLFVGGRGYVRGEGEQRHGAVSRGHVAFVIGDVMEEAGFHLATRFQGLF